MSTRSAPGADFVQAIEDSLESCTAFIAIVDPDWSGAATEDGRRRLDNPQDYVRLEVELALGRRTLVIPVLVAGAMMPYPDTLPDGLQSLTRRNAVLCPMSGGGPTSSRWSTP